MIELAYTSFHTFAFRGSMVTMPEAHNYVAVDSDGIITSFANQPILHDGYYQDAHVTDESPIDAVPFCIGRDKLLASSIFRKQNNEGIIELVPLESTGEYIRCCIEGAQYAIKSNHKWVAFDGDGCLWSFAACPIYDEDLDAWISSNEAELIASATHRVDGHRYKIIEQPDSSFRAERIYKDIPPGYLPGIDPDPEPPQLRMRKSW